MSVLDLVAVLERSPSLSDPAHYQQQLLVSSCDSGDCALEIVLTKDGLGKKR